MRVEYLGLRYGLENRQVVSILLRKKARRRAGRTIDVRRGFHPPCLAEQIRSRISAAPVAPSPASSISTEPQDAVDAVATNCSAASLLICDEKIRQVQYPISSATVRWGELRTNLEDLDLSMLEARQPRCANNYGH